MRYDISWFCFNWLLLGCLLYPDAQVNQPVPGWNAREARRDATFTQEYIRRVTRGKGAVNVGVDVFLRITRATLFQDPNS